MPKLRSVACLAGVIGMVLWVGGGSTARANALIYADIHQRMETILSLQRRLSEQIDRAHQIRLVFKTQKKEYVEEIKAELQHTNISALQNTEGHPRLHFNLKLIGRLTAYIDMLDQRIATFELGKERLEYLRKEADDNIKMIETLNDMQVENLLLRIDEVVAEMHIESEKNLIEPVDGRPDSAWKSRLQEIMADRS